MSTLRNEYVKCGKAGCKMCPHGPYWYEYFREQTGPKKWRTWKRYLGKKDPRKKKLDVPEEAVFSDNPDQVGIAHAIINSEPGMTRQECKRAYVLAKVKCDPTKPKGVLRLQMIEQAWAVLRRENRWG